MSDLFSKVTECVDAIAERTHGFAPKVAVILGSGLGEFADSFEEKQVIPYFELPHFPSSSVQGHAGRLVLGKIEGQKVAAMQGRVHFYEGYAPWQVAFPTRVLCAMKINALVVTNAAGGINLSFKVGDLMTITDHLNLTGWNPLVGSNDERFGPRFPDLSRIYDPALQKLLGACAAQDGVTLRQGVYVGLSGPSYETPAEIRMLRQMGADAVGMSTVPEVITAAHMGVKVAGISCITNLAAGIGDAPLSHAEVSETADKVKPVFGRLLRRFLPKVAV
ncbi:MAG: purine-nucleoside phosphorylase [Myxococcaceae bacterium]|nr:purine-nucleoside phosphorylase [Myxococcaceae bacterium]